MKTRRLFTALTVVGSLLIAATAQAQDPVELATAGGVTLWATPADAPAEGVSAVNLKATTDPSAKIVTVEGLNIAGVHQVFGSFTPPASNEGFENASGPLFNEAWGPFDSHLSFPKSNIAGGVYTPVETNDMSLGDGGLPPAASTAVAQVGIGNIGFANATDAFFFDTPFQSSEIDLAYVVSPDASGTFTAGFLGEGIDNSGGPGVGAYFDAVEIFQSGPPPQADVFCDTSTADVCFDFRSDPVADGAVIIQTGGETTEWRTEGGNGPAPNGYLSITDAANGQRGTIILPDLGGGGQFVFGGRTGGANGAHHVDNLRRRSMTACCRSVLISASVVVQIDQPTVFSFNFVSPDDPLVTNGDGTGYAGIGTENDLPEEGSTTGISIGFDEWQSGDAADPPGSDLSLDVVGMTLRVDGQIIGNASLPTLNGELDDVTSLQTGPRGPGGPGDQSALGWAKLTINAPASGATLENTVVTWKGEPVNFIPEPASGVMILMSLFGLAGLRRKNS